MEPRGRARTLHPLGRGDYVTAAKAYRAVAARDGWRVTRAELARRRKPEVNAPAGAADFKPFVSLKPERRRLAVQHDGRRADQTSVTLRRDRRDGGAPAP